MSLQDYGVDEVFSEKDGTPRILSRVLFNKVSTTVFFNEHGKDQYSVGMNPKGMIEQRFRDAAGRLKIRTFVDGEDGAPGMVLFDNNKQPRVMSLVHTGDKGVTGNIIFDDEGRIRILSGTQDGKHIGQLFFGQTGKGKAYTLMNAEDTTLLYHEKGALEQAGDIFGVISNMRQALDMGSWLLGPDNSKRE